MANRLAKKVLLVGWGSADWHMIDALIKMEKLPILQRLLEEGTKAKISNLDPPLFPATWTSILTGKVPARHNICSFTEINDNKVYPISSNSRKTQAIWNILSDQGMKVHQVGAWASHPAENINGISISDWFIYSDKDTLSDQAIYPIEKKEIFANLLVHADSINKEQVVPFLEATTLDSKDYKAGIKAIKSFIAGTSSIQAAALQILENEEWDQVSVFFNQLSNLTFRFMPYHIEENTNVSTELKAAFKSVLIQAYEHLDAYLGALLAQTDSETAVFLVSQGGYLPDSVWINNLNKPYSTWEYSTPGICLWSLPNVSQKEEMFGMNIMDMTPTILVLMGLPFAKDFDGKLMITKNVLKDFNNLIPSFEKGTNKLPTPISAENGAAILKEQLVDLNYNTDSKYRIQELQEYFDARIKMTIGDAFSALPALEDLWSRYPDNSWYGGRLAGCLFTLNRPEEAIYLLDSVLDIGDESPELHILRGQIYLSEKKFRSAVKEFDIAEKHVGLIAGFKTQIAEAYAQMNQWQIAVKKYRSDVTNNPDPQTYLSIAMLFLQNNKIQKSIMPLENAAKLMPLHPVINFHLGNSYYKTGKYQEAADAFEKAKVYMQDPNALQQIQNNLIQLYREHLKRPDKIKEMREANEKKIGSLGTITIVSGLPRSGTSMMMQMLVEGGMIPFTDGKREADENNQKGYYEHEAVKSLARDKKFLHQVGDKAVKIISHLLSHLPVLYNYKIVFMDREIEEVMHSQHKMLGRLGKERGNDKENSIRLMKPFKESREKAIKWCEVHKKHVDLLLVPYTEALNNPLDQARKVNAFLGGTLDEVAMASVVDKSLYRERTESTEIE